MDHRIISDVAKHTICDHIRDGPHKFNPEIGKFNHYAVILPSGKRGDWWSEVALGINTNRRFRSMPSKHAEIDAIEKIRRWKNLPSEIDLFVIRLTRGGQLTESRPCMHCVMMMVASRLNIRNIYYSTTGGEIAMETMCEMKCSSRQHISSGVRSRHKVQKQNKNKKNKRHKTVRK